MCTVFVFFFFFFIATSSTVIYTLSLHDALPICIWFHSRHVWLLQGADSARRHAGGRARHDIGGGGELGADRKSTRLNSSHITISYAVFCLKKKKTYYNTQTKPCPKHRSSPHIDP